MASYSRKATRNKALWGYLLLVVVLLSSSWFVYHEIGLLVSVREVEEDMTAKRHRVSDALSLLYRTETLGQSLVWGRYSDYPVYRRLMNDAVSCVDSLCNITADSVQLSRIDSIVYLLNRKNSVIRRLMSTSIDVAEEQNRKFDDIMRQQDSLLLIHAHQQKLAQKSDSLMEKRKRRNLFGRIADAISGKSPGGLDSIRSESRRIGALSDSLALDLKAMESGFHESRELSKQALERERWRLRFDNQRLSGQIGRLMSSFEQEQLLVSERILDRNEAIRQESMNALVGVASGAIVLALIFDIMLLSLCNNNAFNVTLPAKLQAYMLNAKPVLVMANGEAQSVVREARCGYGANADSIDKMVRLVLSISRVPKQELEQKGRNGYHYYQRHFRRDKCMNDLFGTIENYKKKGAKK